MREGHQGVPIAALPGSSGGGLFTSLFGGNAPAPQQRAASSEAPIPPAAIGVSSPAARATNGTASLDGWLLNNIFGRR